MIHRLLTDSFLRQNVIFFVGSLVVAVLNYLYHPVMSRLLSVEDFGDVQALISVTYIVGILSLAYRTVLVAQIGGSDHGTHDPRRAHFARSFFLIVLVVSVIMVLASPVIVGALQIGAWWYFVPLALMQLVGVPMHYYSAHLQGIKDFAGVSLTNALMAGMKLLFSVALVVLGYAVGGAIFAFVLASCVALGYAVTRLRRHGGFSQAPQSLSQEQEEKSGLSQYYAHGMLVLVSLGFVTFFYTSDVLVMKYFFSPEEAGLYSGIATIARVIFFATASVAGVLLPSISPQSSREVNIATLRKALLVVVSLCACALIVFALIPVFTISVLIGPQYAAVAHLLLPVGLYVAVCALLNLLATYFLALRDRRFMVPCVVGVFVLFLLVGLFHDTVLQVVWSYLGSAVIAAVCALWIIAKK